MTEINDKAKFSLGYKIIIGIFSGAFFLYFSIPPRSLLSVFTVTEVRFASALYPLLGVNFGLPAAIGIMLGNLYGDINSGYPLDVILEGIIPQFLYTYVPYLIWTRLNRGEDHQHRLDSVRRLLRYVLAVLAFSLLSGFITGLIININYGISLLTSALFVFLNNWIMGIVLGCPAMVLMNKMFRKRKKNYSASEKLILLSGILEILIVAAVIICVYSTSATTENYNIWNRIFLISVVAVNTVMFIMFLIMIIVEKKQNQKTIYLRKKEEDI